jgi:hypothetical protein
MKLGEEITPIKMLICAHSGFGKTGALVSLARAGYKLYVLDLDNGVEVLTGYLEKQYWDNVDVETFTDKFGVINGKPMPLTASAWTAAMTKLDVWTKTVKDAKSVIIIDSLTMLSDAAMRHSMQINQRLGKHPYQSDWGEAQRLIEDCLALLYSRSVTCNIIVNTHITYQGGPASDQDPTKPQTADSVQPLKGFPTSLGKALSPKIPRYFNTMLVGKILGEGSNAQRLYYTNPVDLIDAKAPSNLKSTYPIQTGLADIFKALRP